MRAIRNPKSAIRNHKEAGSSHSESQTARVAKNEDFGQGSSTVGWHRIELCPVHVSKLKTLVSAIAARSVGRSIGRAECALSFRAT
jgi:hypothetical protein